MMAAFDGRQTDKVQEEGGGDGAGEVYMEAAPKCLCQRVGSLRFNIAHRFDKAVLAQILAFDTAQRTTAFVMDLNQTDLMQSGELYQPHPTAAFQQRQHGFRVSLVEPYKGLDNIRDYLPDIADLQRLAFVRAARMDLGVPADVDIPPADGEEELPPSQKPLVPCGVAAHNGMDGAIRKFPQPAMRLFKSFLVKEPKLLALMTFMRAPSENVPPEIFSLWNSIMLKDSDSRLQEERFQNGYMIASYWETVARWIIMRAKRDAKALKTPLYLVQAVDSCSSTMTVDMAKRLRNKPNPMQTGGMHGILPVHLGMKVRLLQTHGLGTGLVNDAEGEVVNIVLDSLDQAEVDADIASGADTIYLRHLPLGFWIRMVKYTRAPFCNALRQLDDSLLPSDTQSLVFIEPTTSKPFVFRGQLAIRTGFPFTHGRVITSRMSQGWSFGAGVMIDCDFMDDGHRFKSDEDRWVELYVMLSRVNRLEDLLLMRAPPCSFLLQGPPKGVRCQFRGVSRIAAASSSTEGGF
jgi:hypothetical protein